MLCISPKKVFFSTENNVKIASDVDAMDKVCKALKMHMNSAEVAEAASAALLSLTLNGKQKLKLLLILILNPQT